MGILAPGTRSSPTGRRLPCRSSPRDLSKRGSKCQPLTRASICSQAALSHLHWFKVALSVTQYVYVGRSHHMRIASFNINNINRRLPNLLAWLRETEPDVVSQQELKASDAEFPLKAIRDAGYEAVWRGQKSWNGVAILARWAPILTCGALPGDPADAQSRYIEAAVNGVLVTSLYAPNGNPQPGPKFGYKLAWLKRLAAHAADLYATGAPVVLAGDYNVVPTDRDIYLTKSWE